MTRYDKEYKADKGKIFVITEKGKAKCKSMAHYEVGEPWDDFGKWTPCWTVDDGYIVEVDDPNFTTTQGYKAVYNHNGYELSCGNPMVYFDKEIAEKIARAWEKRPWNKGEKAYVVETTYEGKVPQPCREYNGKRVYNRDWWFYDAAQIGDLVEEEVVDDAMNALPPACMRSDCMQMGEPSDSRIDENGKGRSTYETFKRIAEGIYEYCGDCFKGENVQRGTNIPYVA